MELLSGIAKAFSGETKSKPDTTIGRNDPCWCGSGVKYKRCHLDSDRRSEQANQKVCCTTT